jgi:hypothetical protein
MTIERVKSSSCDCQEKISMDLIKVSLSLLVVVAAHPKWWCYV